MDKFLSELIKYQSASVTIRSYRDYNNIAGLEGELSIVVKGETHTFTARRNSLKWMMDALGRAFTGHNWAEADVPIVEVHGGVAEVVSGNATVVDFDDSLSRSIMEIALYHNSCPFCDGELGDTGHADRKCPICRRSWTEEDERWK